MTHSFTYQALPMRVMFGIGALRRLPDEVAALGLTRVLVLCSPEQEATGKPRPVTRTAVEALLRAAWSGEPPRQMTT